ncbi:MAG TPA: hypothetical protein PKD92_12615 [Novosphingobium sp.]|nr:hypothetical protein [Novosphingobium sp.]
MSLKVLAALFAVLSIVFIGLLVLAIRQARPGRSMRLAIPRLGIPRLRWQARPRKAKAEHGTPKPSSAAPEVAIARRRTLASISQAGPGAPSPLQTVEDSFAAAVIGRLEQTFSLLERGRISLETYTHDVELIHREVLLRMDEIERSRTSRKVNPDVVARQAQDASGALEAIAWCLEWARQQAVASRGVTTPSPEDQHDGQSLEAA